LRDDTYECIAEWAINGNTDDQYTKHSCSYTNKENEPWWKVTFKYDILVSEVLIVNRDDNHGTFLFNVKFPHFFPVAGWPAVSENDR